MDDETRGVETAIRSINSFNKSNIHSMTDVLSKLTNYFQLFDGTSKSLLENRDVIDNVISDHIIIHGENGDIAHPQYIESIRELLDKGTKVEILEMRIHESGVEYRVRITVPDEDDVHELHSIGVVEDGKLTHVMPVSNAGAYNTLFGDSK